MLLEQLDGLLTFLATFPRQHARDTAFYHFVDAVTKHAFREARPEFEAERPVRLAELGPLILPYKKMGAIDSIDLFGLDELLMFSFYFRNRGRYRQAADIGANLGLHSILMSKCGISTEAFEPDPSHFATLERNLQLNEVHDCKGHMAAVSGRDGKMEFVRVLGNTTSSHLTGAKSNPYGELERFEVDVLDVREIVRRVDLMKIDAEGHEAVLLNTIPLEAWKAIDAFVEVGTPQNAQAILARFTDRGVNVFSQKNGWSRVETPDQMPTTYKEGGIFVSCKAEMPW